MAVGRPPWIFFSSLEEEQYLPNRSTQSKRVSVRLPSRWPRDCKMGTTLAKKSKLSAGPFVNDNSLRCVSCVSENRASTSTMRPITNETLSVPLKQMNETNASVSVSPLPPAAAKHRESQSIPDHGQESGEKVDDTLATVRSVKVQRRITINWTLHHCCESRHNSS